MAIDKQPNREGLRLHELNASLHSQLTEFEMRYGMSTTTFLERFKRGELGDDMDYMEWVATAEMLHNAEKHLSLLPGETGHEHAY